MQGQTTSSSPLPPPPQACASTQTPPIGTSLEGNSWADKVKGAPPPRVIKEATPPDGALKPAPTKPTPEEGKSVHVNMKCDSVVNKCDESKCSGYL